MQHHMYEIYFEEKPDCDQIHSIITSITSVFWSIYKLAYQTIDYEYRFSANLYYALKKESPLEKEIELPLLKAMQPFDVKILLPNLVTKSKMFVYAKTDPLEAISFAMRNIHTNNSIKVDVEDKILEERLFKKYITRSVISIVGDLKSLLSRDILDRHELFILGSKLSMITSDIIDSLVPNLDDKNASIIASVRNILNKDEK